MLIQASRTRSAVGRTRGVRRARRARRPPELPGHDPHPAARARRDRQGTGTAPRCGPAATRSPCHSFSLQPEGARRPWRPERPSGPGARSAQPKPMASSRLPAPASVPLRCPLPTRRAPVEADAPDAEAPGPGLPMPQGSRWRQSRSSSSVDLGRGAAPGPPAARGRGRRRRAPRAPRRRTARGRPRAGPRRRVRPAAMWCPPKRSSRSPQRCSARVQVEAGDAAAAPLPDRRRRGRSGRPAGRSAPPPATPRCRRRPGCQPSEASTRAASRVGIARRARPAAIASSRIRWSSAWRSAFSASSAAGQLLGFGRVVGEQQPQPVGGVADPAGRVEPGREHEADLAGADLLVGQAAHPDQRPRARASGLAPAAGVRAAPGCGSRPVSGTTSATVASATRSSRCNGRLGGRPSAGTSACTSLKAMPVPQSWTEPGVVAGLLRVHDGVGGRQLVAREGGGR